uniref:Uncharacterized protein n=1 Tax=viral metagenome TaxID=1070528 RepID=A0A6C0KV56_9ZZZZ
MYHYFKHTVTMDATTSDVLSKLKFIGKIQKGEKINVKYLYVQPSNWFTRLSRTFYMTDNRMNAYNFIETTIGRCFEIITVNKQTKTSTSFKLVENILADIKDAIIGIQNFKDTYSYDVMFCCKLDTLIDSIRFRINDGRVSFEMDEVD